MCMLTNTNIPMIMAKMRIVRKTRPNDSEMSVEDVFSKYPAFLKLLAYSLYIYYNIMTTI